MTADMLRNAILLLNCIDADEFFQAGVEYYTNLNVSDEAAAAEWASFRENPSRFFIHASDAHRAALWAIIEKRLTVADTTTKAAAPHMLDKAWAEINEERFILNPAPDYNQGVNVGLDIALGVIEKLGGMDPANRSK